MAWTAISASGSSAVFQTSVFQLNVFQHAGNLWDDITPAAQTSYPALFQTSIFQSNIFQHEVIGSGTWTNISPSEP